MRSILKKDAANQTILILNWLTGIYSFPVHISFIARVTYKYYVHKIYKGVNMAGWFDLIKSNGRQFRFVLKAANGETILTSKLYTTKRAAEIGIASVQINSSLDDRYVLKDFSNNKFYFNIRAANHHIIGKVRYIPPLNLVILV